MIKEIIGKLVEKKDLSEAEMIGTMQEIMGGEATPAQIAAFITALRMKGETIKEITGAAKVMRERAIPIRVKNEVVSLDREEINIDRETIIDTCGTGGDSTSTFNVSTASAFVVAGAGLRVAKHGNRSVSSHCGSADVIQALGVNLDVPPEKIEECMSRIGIGFLYAPALHGAMKNVIGPRREIGIRTIFNILGPLTNPAKANVQVLGVYRPELTEVLAKVLKNLGSRRALVVHGEDGLDEITITGYTRVSELKGGKISTYKIHPEDFGLKTGKFKDLKGGDAQKNAQIILDILKGKKGTKRNIVVLNAAAAIVASGKASNFLGGAKLAVQSIDEGRALEKLNKLIEFTNS